MSDLSGRSDAASELDPQLDGDELEDVPANDDDETELPVKKGRKKEKAKAAGPTPEQIAEAQRIEAEAQRLRDEAAAEEARILREAQAARDAAEAKVRARHASNDSLRRSAVLLEDALLVEASSLPIRNYLLQNVMPALVDGLLDVVRQQPEDPVDALAEYLFRYAVDRPADEQNAQERPQA